MKRKKIIVIIFLIIIIAILTIGIYIFINNNKKDNTNYVQDETIINSNSQLTIYDIDGAGEINFSILDKETNVITQIARKNGKMYLKVSDNSNNVYENLIYDNGIMYTLNNTDKTYTKEQYNEEDFYDIITIFSTNKLDRAETEEVITGVETIEGLECSYERIDTVEEIDTYYFYNNRLKFIKYEYEDYESYFEILNYSKTVDDSLFVIPEEYTEVIE